MAGRVVRVRERPQVDLLVLAVLAAGPRDHAGVRDALADGGDPTGSGSAGSAVGSVAVSATRIVPTLHRLARNRLVARERPGSRRYVLTEVGRRSLRARASDAMRYAEAVRTLADGG